MEFGAIPVGLHRMKKSNPVHLQEEKMGMVNSILRAIRILDILKESDPLSYMAILKRMDIPKSTLFKVLATMEQADLIRRDPETNKYQLGVKLIEWGTASRSQIEIRKIASPFMRMLNDKLDCTIHLIMIVHDEILNIESIESKNWYWHHFKYPVAIGFSAPLHCTGPGKVMLASLSEADVKDLIRKKGLEKFTENTITDKKALHEELEQIRRQGYAVSNAEHDELIRSVAAPIRNHEGTVIAAISVLGIVSRVTEQRVPEIAGLVVDAANEISQQMGYCSERP